MLIDMKDVRYVSSYLIGVLVGCHKLLKKSGYDLHLSGLSSHLRMVLEVSGLTDVFPSHETREEGLAYFDRAAV
jgi:anti-anti-sigma factor